MPAPVPANHPLRRLFVVLTERTFVQRLGWPDHDVAGYLSDLLTEFTHTDNLYRIRNARGKRVEEVAEMLLEADLLERANTLEREREVHRHIGDFTLFMTGLFPEYVGNLRPSRSADALLDYVQVGKHSYAVVAEFTHGPYGSSAPLFRKLSENFELCVYGLGFVREDLDRLRTPEYAHVRKMLV